MAVEQIISILIPILAVLLFVCGGRWAYRREERDYNDGFCPKCLTVWRSFDMDSQGGRGYHCECKPARYIWISYPGIENRRAKGGG